jgi:hypothetical protein
VNWGNFIESSHSTRGFVRSLADTRKTLRELVLNVRKSERLFAMCERHQLLDYIVLHEAPERGFRLRLHMSTDDHFDRPHDHRFSFTSLILSGGYRHTWYEASRDPYQESDEDGARQYDSLRRHDQSSAHLLSVVSPQLMRDEKPGSSYTMHHSVLHTTFTQPGTVSLFLRGPNEKRRSVIMDKVTGRVWWRYGRDEESAERRQSKRMTLADYDEFIAKLESLSIIHGVGDCLRCSVSLQLKRAFPLGRRSRGFARRSSIAWTSGCATSSRARHSC